MDVNQPKISHYEKKKSGDEFLVEKKAPCFTSNYGELPTPIEENLKEVEKIQL